MLHTSFRENEYIYLKFIKVNIYNIRLIETNFHKTYHQKTNLRYFNLNRTVFKNMDNIFILYRRIKGTHLSCILIQLKK